MQVSVNDPALLFGSNGLAISEELKLIFNGAWTLKGKNSNVDIFEYGSNSTTFILRLYNGEPVDFTLEPNDIEMQTLITVNDAFLEGVRGFNTNLIRTEPNEKKGYLMFDISKIKSTVFTTNLQLLYFGTTQDASLVLSLGDSNNWDEFNLSIGNAPKVEHVLDSLNTPFISGNVYRFSIPSETLIEKDTITFIIEQINGDKMGFASKENTANGVTAPTLILMKSKSIDTSVLYPSKKLQEFNIVYPNPFQSSFSLKNDKRCQLTIFTLNGKKLFSTLVNSKAEVAPDYEIIPPGTYLIKLNFFDGIESGKIIRL